MGGAGGDTSGENSIGPGMKSFGRTCSLSYPPMGAENFVTLREKTVGTAERHAAWDAELDTVAAMARRAAGNTAIGKKFRCEDFKKETWWNSALADSVPRALKCTKNRNWSALFRSGIFDFEDVSREMAKTIISIQSTSG